ncbi:C39 family peptidase [Rhodoferax ferrireducens]|uniref:C39 family peptidase n=1 Tax=Rhodoferax ferrireducens TaxID=192843 RepID=UPI00298D68AB|nr:C39 family peptidase [Rhodoferax ferrireducens]WPC66102.1 C39 family peptidase [Rhodoferax ferrireducens]
MRTALAWVVAAVAATCAPAQADTLELAGIGGRYAVHVTSLKEARFKATTRQQYDFSCGSAAVATLLSYHYGYPVTEQSVFEEMFARGDQAKIRQEGFSLLDMKAYLNAHQFQADGFELPLAKLLEAGLPAIVLISDNGYHHFVVVKGMRDGRILIGDPSSGTRAVSRANFESVWVNKLLFVIHNKQAQAKFNDEADWLVAPKAPLTAGVSLDSLTNVTLSKFGPGDY